MLKFHLILSTSLICTILSGQTFDKNYEGGGGNSIITSHDGNYLVASSIFNSLGSIPLQLIKINKIGDIIWTKQYGPVVPPPNVSSAGIAYCLLKRKSGGYVVAGQAGVADPFGEQVSDAFIARLNEFGDTVWTFTLDSGAGEKIFSIEEDFDGCFSFTGVLKTALNGNDPTGFFAKVDSMGKLLWIKTYQKPSYFHSAKQLANGSGYIIVGNGHDRPGSTATFYMIRIDPLGNVIWKKNSDWGIPNGTAFKVREVDHTFTITGLSFHGNKQYGLLLNTDSTGNINWFKQYGGGLNDAFYDINLCKDKGYILTGRKSGNVTTEADKLWLVKVNHIGDTVWSKVYGKQETIYGNGVLQTLDGNFIITGYVASNLRNTFVLKTDTLGNLVPYNGIDQIRINENSAEMRVYPNPFRNFISISFPEEMNIMKNTELQLAVIDSQGATVIIQTIKYLGLPIKLDLSSLNPGIYSITLTCKKFRYQKKVLKVLESH